MSRFICPIQEQISEGLNELAGQIRASSNFKVAWQWFQTSGFALDSADAMRKILSGLIAEQSCHEFLRNPDGALKVWEPSISTRFILRNREFRETLASAAAD